MFWESKQTAWHCRDVKDAGADLAAGEEDESADCSRYQGGNWQVGRQAGGRLAG